MGGALGGSEGEGEMQHDLESIQHMFYEDSILTRNAPFSASPYGTFKRQLIVFAE